ncbi:hypothetical protein GCM10007415_13870 [Parapedobacter pyrenivorans]|uniref:Uncharacterized protein n=1 Tax=Parapedobacter pyrenivorans TaxID=1305674 RepID=A0A917M7F4_9SPHI|nr:DUF5690 family protein [Parapedobacter pyrenivorans]GGG82272.1 hypothetical protein GCM10007415_13870 [Parapedobacter pyrenivorans]
MRHWVGTIRNNVGQLPYRYAMLLMGLAAFGCYTSMYAFRKAFTAGTFEGISFWGIDYKVWLVIAQVFGYMLSKFYGIRFIAELGERGRGYKIIILVGIAWVALLGFAVIPAPYNIVFLFMNGLPLGMIWGLVFSYLEGRRATEFLGSVMSVSLVFASGFVKTTGRTLIESHHISETWMPFCTGLLFVVPLLACTLLLEWLPSPDAQDKVMRTERKAMGKQERKTFIQTYLPGLVLTVGAYLLFTIIRDVRDNFEVEIWSAVGISDKHIYAQTDTAIALAVLMMMALLIFVKNNKTAFTLIHLMVICGCVCAGLATWLFQQGSIGSIGWMTVAGLGVYMVYIPYNAIFFERMLASFQHRGNIGFVMYVADAIGYLGSVSVLVVKELGFVHLSWGAFYKQALLIAALLGVILVSLSLLYFHQKWGSKRGKSKHPLVEGTVSYSGI